ncbi:MAG: flagellar hook capping FlgD N-terminal domain-containing protein [Sphingobium sp.]
MTTALQTLSSSWTVDSSTSYQNSLLTSTVGTQGTGDKTMGQTDYLKLLTAQLQYQDPFEPMDNSQMVSQMAQLSQITGQNETNTTLKSIAESLSGARLSDAASWIGKAMLVKSNVVAPDISGQYAGQITLSAASTDLKVDLVDSSGSVVKSFDMGAQSAGPINFYWDGKDADGNQASTGQLTIRVSGGTTSQVAAWATVAAVQSPASGSNATLVTTLGQYTAADALSIS